MRLSELAEYSLQISQREADERVRRTSEDGLALSCRKGCGACCRQVVPVSPPEAWMLAELVQGMPAERRGGVLARFSDSTGVLQSNGMGDMPLLSGGREYFRLGIPCPFLDSEACGIYPHRPSACRDYIVTSPAYMCASPEIHSIATLPVRLRISECLSEIAGNLLGWGNLMIPLVRALDWAAEFETEGRRNWDQDYLTSLLDQAIRSKCNSTK